MVISRDAAQIPYDVLIVAVGAVNNTFHTPGVREHAFFLKEVRCAEHLVLRRAVAVVETSRHSC